MRCPVLVGRDELAEELAEVVLAARAGHGRALLLLGEPGVGKTRLVDHATAVADHAGVRVFRAGATCSPAPRPYAMWAEALLGLMRDEPPPDDPALVPYEPVLATLLPHWRPRTWHPPDEPPVVLAEGILRLLRHVGAGEGLLVSLEDLHWADEGSLTLAAHICSQIPALAISVIASARDVEGEDARLVLEQRGAGARFVPRLSGIETDEMISACLGAAELDPGVGERLARNADGLPLLVEDLLDVAADEVPRRFADTVRRRLSSLDDTSRTIVMAAALVGAEVDLATLGELFGDAAVASAVQAAVRHDLIVETVSGTLGFRHALTRDVLASLLLAPERSDLARRAAASLTASAADPDVDAASRAAELLVVAGEADAAACMLHDAGQRALRSGVFGVAESLLDRASALAATRPLAWDIGRDLTRARLAVGRPDDAADVAVATMAEVEGRDRLRFAQLQLLRARAAVAVGDWAEATAALDAATEHADPIERALLRAQVDLGAGDARRSEAEHGASVAVGLALEGDRPDLTCEALETLGRAARLRDLDAAADALERALGIAEDHGLAAERLHVLNELGTVELLRDARSDRLERARVDAVAAGAVAEAVGLAANLAAVCVMTGRYEEADRWADEAIGDAALLGLTPLEAASHLMKGVGAGHRGRRREMDRELARAEELAPADKDLRAGAWALGRGLFALSNEDRQGARRAFARARAEAPDVHARVLNPYAGPELLLRAVSRDVEEADVVAAVEAAVVGARWEQMWVRAALAVMRGDPALLADALAAADPYPLFGALIRRLVAESMLAGGRWSDPVALLQPAHEVFARLDLAAATSACRGLLKRAGAPAPRRRSGDSDLPTVLRKAGVTGREAEVLALLGDHLSNKEIATRLYLSDRTVEKHVAALRRKLGGADRRGLADLARSLGPPV